MDRRDTIMRRLFDDLLRVLRPSIVCDVGAFDGDESIRFAQILPASHVVAFEASEDNINNYWRGNAEVEQLPQIHYEFLAVTDRTGTVSFNILDSSDSSAAWRAAANSLFDRTDDLPHRKVSVPATTLDDYFGQATIQLNTFALWIDVEGALEQVLNGAQHLLERTMFLRAEVERKEFWRGQMLAEESMAQIAAAGFVCIGDTHLPNAYEQSNVLYVRSGLLDLLSRRPPIAEDLDLPAPLL